MDITAVCLAIIALVAVVISVFAIPWLVDRTTAEERAELMEWVEIGVMAAQQLLHHLSGTERKNYVLEFLKDKGYEVNTQEIENAIEAAVLKLHQQMLAKV